MRNRGSKFLNFIALVPIILCVIWCLAFTVIVYADANSLTSGIWDVILDVCHIITKLQSIITGILAIQIPIILGVFIFNIKRLREYVSYFVLSIAGYVSYYVSFCYIAVLIVYQFSDFY